MAAQVGALRVAVGADITGLQTGMKRAERQVQQSAGVMQRAVGGINKSLSGIGAVAGLSLGAAGLMVGARAFLSIADAAKTMTAQLKLATAQYGSFAQANKDVRAIAEGSRASLTATAELYSAIQRNAGELGNTQAQTARVTETITKSFAVFGSTAMQAEQATRQLIQAFQSGRLQGDEFRSMMENAPRLVKMLADSLGVTTGKLREMSKEGELTADKLLAAFSDLKLTEALDKEFAQMPVTFDQAMTGLYNAAIITFSAFDQGGQFSNSIAGFVTQGTAGFKELETSAFEFGRGLADLGVALEEIRSTIGALHTGGIGAFVGLTNATFSWRDALSGTLGVLDGVINRVSNLFQFPANIGRAMFGGTPVVNPSDMRGGFLAKTNKADLDRTRRNIMGRSIQDILGEAGMGTRPPPFQPPPGKTKKPKKGPRAKKPPRDRSEDVEFGFENEIRQAQMDLLRAQQELAGTAGERANISLKMLDLEGQVFEAGLEDKVRRARRDFAEGKITETSLRQVEAHSESLRAKYNETDILKRQLIAQEAILHRKERERNIAERSFENQVEGLRFEDEIATTQAERRRIQLAIVDTLYKQKDAHLRALKAELELAGKIEEAADVQAQIDQLPAEQARDQERTRQGTRGPLEEWRASIPQTAAEINEAFQSIQAQGLDSLANGLTEVIMGTKSLGDAFKEMAAQIVADLIRMTIRMLIFRTISGMMGGMSGGGLMPGSSEFLPGWGSTGDLSKLKGFATGGAFNILGRGGRDRNILGLNGVPIARVSHGERVNVGTANSGGGQTVINMNGVITNDQFWAEVDQRNHVSIARAAPAIVEASARNVNRSMTRPKLA